MESLHLQEVQSFCNSIHNELNLHQFICKNLQKADPYVCTDSTTWIREEKCLEGNLILSGQFISKYFHMMMTCFYLNMQMNVNIYKKHWAPKN